MEKYSKKIFLNNLKVLSGQCGRLQNIPASEEGSLMRAVIDQ